MTTQNQTMTIVGKNRKRAFWSLVIVAFMLPVSGWLLVTGLQPGRPIVAWALVAFGVAGIVAFAIAGVAVVRTMLSNWHLALTPDALQLHTPTYRLDVPWERVAGIAVDEVNRRPGCVLIFDDAAAVAKCAVFEDTSRRSVAVTDAATMQARLEDNLARSGYHLGIPGRMLELGPDELAALLTRACTGALWQGKEAQR